MSVIFSAVTGAGMLGMKVPAALTGGKPEAPEREGFEDAGGAGLTAVVVLLNIINTAIFVFAIFLSFKRNGGFDFGSFLAACCCSLCYVVYALAVPRTPSPAVSQ